MSDKKTMTAFDYIKNQPHLQGKPLSLPPTSSPLADFPPLTYSKAAATPASLKPFSTPGFHIQGYTYIDYINAFFRTFYLRPYDHSWFISFDIKCPKHFTGWFAEWWVWFGPTDEIYPDTVLKSSIPYYIKNQPQGQTGSLAKIYFHIDMGVPWICSWHFNVAPYFNNTPFSLLREFRVKWWDKYNLDRCSLSQIQRFFSTTQLFKQAIQFVSKTTPSVSQPTPPANTSHMKNLIEKYGKDPTQKQSSKATTSTTSPSPSTSTKKAKKTVNQERLQQMFEELQKQLLGDDDNEDEDMQEPDDSGAKQNPPDLDDDLFGGPLAQDPFTKK